MKKQLLLVLRLMVAAAGIGYIVWSLTWTDQVVVPAYITLPDGQLLDEPTAYDVVEGTADDFDSGGLIRIDIPSTTVMTVPVTPRGSDGQKFQFKSGVVTTLRRANGWLLLLGLLIVGPVYPIQGLRWLILLQARGMQVRFGKSFRLLMVGNFFNYCMPGSTGGDVVKAFYASKGSGRRVDAVMSIIFDRITGMLGLILLGGCAGLFMLDSAPARRVAATIWLLALVIALAAVIYFTPALRRWLGIDWVLARLPGQNLLASIDEAAIAYRHHKAAVTVGIVMSVVVHLCLVGAASAAGVALGIGQPLGLMISILPLLNLGMALPISYQGLGIMEAIGMPLLVKAPLCTPNQLIGMLLMYRLYLVAYALLGALFLLRGDIHLHEPAEGTTADVQSAVPGSGQGSRANHG